MKQKQKVVVAVLLSNKIDFKDKTVKLTKITVIL